MEVLKVTATLESIAPLSFSKPLTSVKRTGEKDEALEERAWRERMHVDENGEVFIPPIMLKNTLSATAQYLSESVPGKGQAKYTKHVEAGVMVEDRIPLGIKADTVPGEKLFVPSDGKRGGGKRVNRIYPRIDQWKGTCTIYVLDPVLIAHPEKIREYLEHAGKFIGFGRWRPRQNGLYGRFIVTAFKAVMVEM